MFHTENLDWPQYLDSRFRCKVFITENAGLNCIDETRILGNIFKRSRPQVIHVKLLVWRCNVPKKMEVSVLISLACGKPTFIKMYEVLGGFCYLHHYSRNRWSRSSRFLKYFSRLTNLINKFITILTDT